MVGLVYYLLTGCSLICKILPRTNSSIAYFFTSSKMEKISFMTLTQDGSKAGQWLGHEGKGFEAFGNFLNYFCHIIGKLLSHIHSHTDRLFTQTDFSHMHTHTIFTHSLTQFHTFTHIYHLFTPPYTLTLSHTYHTFIPMHTHF